MVEFGLMQDTPLMISSLLRHAARFNGGQKLVTVKVEDGSVHRYGYRDAERRARRCAQALNRLGVGQSDRIATLAWNSFRHFELCYAISGSGAVFHTINPRLFEDQIRYIVNHAEDKLVFLDLTFVPLVERMAGDLPSVEAVIILTDNDHMPDTSLPNVLCYEDLIDQEDGDYEWPAFDDRLAATLCYTSGTTGNPKGVLGSHKAIVIHTLYALPSYVFGLNPFETIVMVVPMFHANGWSFPYTAPVSGAQLVWPGAKADPETLLNLVKNENASYAAGVLSVWTPFLKYIRETGRDLQPLKHVLIGGSAVPPAMFDEFEQEYGVKVMTGWGMTELSPLGTLSSLTPRVEEMAPAEKRRMETETAGRVFYPVDIKIVGKDGVRVPDDGESVGDIWVKGPSVASAYYKQQDETPLDSEGYFPTGDVGTLNGEGYLRITDRTKDVIKSGGEWISSIVLENIATRHPGIQAAAVIGVRHARWNERPLLVAVAEKGQQPDKAEILSLFDGKVAKWWIPDDVAFVDEMPLTATGKIRKKNLRETFADHLELQIGSAESELSV